MFYVENQTGGGSEYFDDFPGACQEWGERERIGIPARVIDADGVKVMGGYEAVDVTAKACLRLLSIYRTRSDHGDLRDVPFWLMDRMDKLADES